MDKLREDSQVDEGGPRWTKVDAAAFLSSALQDENAMLSCMMEETDLGNWLKDPFPSEVFLCTKPRSKHILWPLLARHHTWPEKVQEFTSIIHIAMLRVQGRLMNLGPASWQLLLSCHHLLEDRGPRPQ